MWMRFAPILQEGLKYDKKNTELELYSKDQQHHIKLFLLLKADAPDILHMVRHYGIDIITDFLDARCNDACGEDVKHVKDHAQYLRPTSNPFSPPLSITDKVIRGFRHPQLAHLIRPLGWLAEFDDSEIFRQQLADGKKLAHPHDWPLFLFDEETFDMEDLFKSFLCNEMLVQAWRLIFQGPSALDGHPSPNAKRGNACLNGMKKVTVAALAYVATLVYFALSSQETFRPRGNGHTFDFYTFYSGLITCVNEDAMAKDHDAILLWWNKQAFPNHMHTDNKGHANPPAQTGRGLQAQACLRD
ncbi:hypothetical protein JB92DRAFT_3244319 [Gautieria morchelliformis]|nr:hypothetical protein JB92DRAFT_3244319 [Gautieria morchelliformis]